MNPNILDDNEQIFFVQIDEDEDQGFGAQFNDDCQSSDDENNHLSTLSLNNNNDNELIDIKKSFLRHSQSDIQLNKKFFKKFSSLPNLRQINSSNSFEKIEHFIIDDQQPITTISNLIIKKKQDDDDNEDVLERKKKILRKSSEEIIEISNRETSPQVKEKTNKLFDEVFFKDYC